MDQTELKFDPQNLPKYCPQCKLKGLKSKVKLFNVNGNGETKLVMCKNSEVSCNKTNPSYFTLFCISVSLALLSCF